jgi:hypothetical protein
MTHFLCDDAFLVWWRISCVMTHFLCDDAFLVWWRISCVMTHFLCDDAFLVWWRISCVMTHFLFDGAFLVWWRISCVVTHFLCGDAFLVWWRISCVVTHFLCDDVFLWQLFASISRSLFANTWILFFTLVSQTAQMLLPGKLPLEYHLCHGSDPDEFGEQEPIWWFRFGRNLQRKPNRGQINICKNSLIFFRCFWFNRYVINNQLNFFL